MADGSRWLLTAALSLALCACGFQLRSYSLEGEVAAYSITGLTRAQVVPPLRRALGQIGVGEVEPEQAAIVVNILDERSDRRSVSTTGQARAEEYELAYAVEYELLDGAGAVLAPANWIQRQRVYQIDRGNIVGSSEEQALLNNELMRDVAGQMLRAMDLVSRQQASASSAANDPQNPGPDQGAD